MTDFKDLSLEEIENILNSNDNDESVSTFSISPSRAAAKSSAMRYVDLVLVVDTTGSMGSQIAAVKRNLSTLIAKLREDGISLYVSVVDYRDITCDGKDSTKVNNNSGVDFYSSPDDIAKVINSLSPWGGGDFEETAIDGLGAAYNLCYRTGSAKYAFLITDATYKINNNYGISDMATMANMLKDSKIPTSVITYPSYFDKYNNLTVLSGGELISMYGNFCDEMYRIISCKTPAENVVIANNIVSGFFNEPLVKGGTCDTDGDTLTDSDEVDWNNVKNVYNDGSYDLYTWKELCERSHWWFIKWSDYADGESNDLFEALSGFKVIPATSNPFSADSDKDYYPDNVEVDDKSLDVLASNAMFINDEGICDANFHNGSSISVPVENKYTDGVFEKYFETHTDGNRQERVRYSFTRRPTEHVKFSLTPKSTSFYSFNDFSYSSYIGVTYKGWFGQPEYVSRKEDGTYLLERGIEYTVEVYNFSSYEYKFTVEQDNWVYAEYGAVCTAHESATIFDSSDYQSIYITDKGLHQIINNFYVERLGHKNGISYDDFIHIEDNGERNTMNPFYYNCILNEQFLNEAQTYGDAMSDSLNSIIGTIASITGVYLLIPGSSTAAAAIVTVIGGASTVYSIQSALFNAHIENKRQEFIDAMYDGKFNFYIYNLSNTSAFITYNHSEYKSFHPWNTDHYVNKIHLNTVYKVEPLTITTLQEQGDGTWRVIP